MVPLIVSNLFFNDMIVKRVYNYFIFEEEYLVALL